ncbi:hypothetical protein SAMN05421493_10720 [Pseudobutyrivibrio sp. 49]|nr:hypothetical protein SAMN05421493_10720 [Pseudobutyrivibrio sp. 49]
MFKINQLNKFLKPALSFVLAASLVVPATTNVALASELSLTHKPSSEKIFIPFRNEIPHYLSLNSSQKSEVVKMLWEKLFYEEANWNADKEGFTSWIEKYDDYYSSNDGTIKLLSDGTQNGNITGSTGDFEAYFGNTIKNNTEYLGEILGLAEKTTNEIMQKNVCNYLSNPDTYTIFATKIADLTSEGLYIGTKKGSDNNILKDGSYNGISYDLYVLTTLASLYEGDGNESYLSDKQVEWLKSYQEYLYDQYLTIGENSLAKKYPSIYDLIARSKYAANDKGGKGQEFFNYVVSTGKGMGAWLNMNDKINIKDLEKYDDICSVFALADGWCCGNESASVCGSHAKCISNANDVERVAYLLYKNSAAMKYINGCSATANLINDTNGEYGYGTRFTAKHSGAGQSGKFFRPFYTGGGYYGYSATTRDYASDGNGDVTAVHVGTASLPLGKLGLINSSSFVYVTGLKEPATQGWFVENKLVSWSVTVNGNPIATDKNQSRVQSVFTSQGLRFYIGGLTDVERAGAQINITAQSHKSYDLNYPNGSPSSFTSIAAVSISGTVYLEGYYPDCIANGHNYTVSEDNDTIIWAKDYAEATFKPYCTKEASHKVKPITVSSEIITEGNYLVYTAYCPYVDSTVTKRISKTNGSTSETINLDATNTSGVLYKSASSSNAVFSGGSKSSESYKLARTTISASVLPGVIKSGTKSITVNMDYGNELTNLVIQVFSATGEELGRNAATTTGMANEVGGYQFSNTFTVKLRTGITDKDLKNCRMTINAEVVTQNWSPSGNPNAYVADAFTYARINSFTAHY